MHVVAIRRRRRRRRPSAFESMLVIPGIFVAAWQLGRGIFDVGRSAGRGTAKALGVVGMLAPKRKKGKRGRNRDGSGRFVPSGNANGRTDMEIEFKGKMKNKNAKDGGKAGKEGIFGKSGIEFVPLSKAGLGR